jgi:ABC-2 type transport system permease protein
MKKYFQLLKNYFQTSLEYRANLVSLIINQIISTSGILFLWLAIYRTNERIEDYTFDKALLYYILVPLSGYITQVYISNTLAREIRKGELSRYLLKPYKVWIVALIRAVAAKLHILILIIPIYILVLSIYFSHAEISLSFRSILFAFTIASGAFILNTAIDFVISWLAFWFDDVWAFEHLKFVLFSVLGGVSIPFEFLTSQLRHLFEALPFKFLYYVPISYLTGNKDSLELLLHDLSSLIVWTLPFILLSYILWKLGIRKYEAYGD